MSMFYCSTSFPDVYLYRVTYFLTECPLSTVASRQRFAVTCLLGFQCLIAEQPLLIQLTVLQRTDHRAPGFSAMRTVVEATQRRQRLNIGEQLIQAVFGFCQLQFTHAGAV